MNCLLLTILMTPAMTPPIALKSGADVDAALGEVVVFEGVAENAKLSAIVLAEGFSVYVIETSEWDGATQGRRVRVTGRLSRTDQFAARMTKSGITQGTAGGDLVVREVKVEVLPVAAPVSRTSSP